MIAINAGMIGAAAMIAFGLVAADQVTSGHINSIAPDSSQNRIDDGDNSADFVKLNLQAKAALNALTERQEANARQRTEAAAHSQCQNQTWPYYSQDCLTSVSGTQVRRPHRVVGVERHFQQAEQRTAAHHPQAGNALQVSATGWFQCMSGTWPYYSAGCAPVPTTTLIAQVQPAIDISRPAQSSAPRLTRVASIAVTSDR